MKYYCLSLMYSSVFLCFDNFVYYRLREFGLLTLALLVEGGPVQLDQSLLTALVDRWRPETHTFHLPCGEMTPTLQDVAYLLGLPIVGEVVGPRVVAASWKDDLEARFALVDRVKKQVRSTRTHEQQVLRRPGSYSLQYVFIAYLSLIVTIHMLHCQLKPLILIVYAACPVGCGCR